MIRPKTAAVVLAGIALSATLTGCSDPCPTAEVTAEDIALAERGREVEVEVDGYECELNPRTGKFEMDS